MPDSVINWIRVTEFNLPERSSVEVGGEIKKSCFSNYVFILSKEYGIGYGIYDYINNYWTTYPIGMNEESYDEVLYYAYMPIQQCIDLLQEATNSTGMGVKRLIENL